MALVRVNDADAIAKVVKTMDAESSFARRNMMAHSLALAQDERGFEVLREALGSKRRDERMDAARILAELGDDSGRKQLESMMSNKRLRLSAAANLALLGVDEGFGLLREAARDKAEETRLRAVVALGMAGDREVADDLLALLEANEYVVGASAALAVLADRSSIPALEAQLASPSLRVPAAVGLRRFEDAEPNLKPLVSGLTKGDELASVQAAEALLILLHQELPAELR